MKKIIPLNIILILMIFLYSFIFFYLIISPLIIDFPITPKNLNQIDGLFYFNSIKLLTEDILILLEIYRKLFFLENIEQYRNYFPAAEFFMPGPIYPYLIYFFDYNEKNYLPLSIFYLLICIYINYLWIKFFKNQKINIYFILFFIFWPYQLYYSIFTSTDLLLSLAFTKTFILLSSNKNNSNYLLLLALSFLSPAIRPNGIVITLIILIYFTFFSNLSLRNLFYIVFFHLIILLLASLYYLPYFLLWAGFITYEGVYNSQTIFGINNINLNNSIPEIFLDILLYYFGKILYLHGLHPSGSGSLLGLSIRTFWGLIFIIGSFATFIYGKKIDKYFLFLLMFPLLIGVCTERYTFFIFPVTYYYFYIFINNIFYKVK